MRRRRIMALAALYLAALGALHLFAVPRLESAARALYREQVLKRLAEDASALSARPGMEPFYLGVYRPELPLHFAKVYEIEKGLGARVSIISWYQAWGDGEEHDFDRELAENVARGGFIPMITWEPWVAAFDKHRGLEVDSSLALVAQGEFDDYVRKWAREATRFGKPMFLRFAHEISNPWYPWGDAHGNTPEMYTAAWRRVHRIFREEGARNVAFVWNPYQPRDTAYWPGADYVDWIGLDVFNFGPEVEDGFWMDYASALRDLHSVVRSYGKPILIAEAGSVPTGGNKSIWYRDMFQSLARGEFPGIRGVVLFDNPSGRAPNGIPVDLAMTSDTGAYAAVRAEDLRRLGLVPRH